MHEYNSHRRARHEASAARARTIDALKTRPELIAAIGGLHHDYPGSFFFGSSTGQDAVDSSLIIVELSAGGLGLPDRDYI